MLEVNIKKRKRAFFITIFILFILICLSVGIPALLGSIPLEKLGTFVYYVFSGFLVMILLTWGIARLLGYIFRVKEKWGLVYFVSFLCIILIGKGVSYFRDTQMTLETKDVIRNVDIGNDGIIKVTQNNDLKTGIAQKQQDFFLYIQEAQSGNNEKLVELELYMLDADIYTDKEKLTLAIEKIDELIEFSEEYVDIYRSKLQKKYKEVFGKDGKIMTEEVYKQQKNIARLGKEKYLRVREYYAFTLENFDLIQIADDGYVSFSDTDVDERGNVLFQTYEEAYEKHEKAYNNFIKKVQEEMKTLQQ